MNDFKDPQNDRELEQMLESLSEDAREHLLEEHRQLEKDLLRLADPLPPADFVNRVMQKVAAAPARPVSAKEIVWASLITVAAFSAGVLALLASGSGVQGVGLSFANAFVRLREVVIGLASGFDAVWSTAAVPAAFALVAMVLSSVVALKKLGTEAKVAS